MPRGARRRAAFEAARTKSFGSSAWPRYAQAIHTLANTICGQAPQPARRAAHHVPQRHATGAWPPVCRFLGGADKVFRIKCLIAVCAGYPHACQQNLWVSGRCRFGPHAAVMTGGGRPLSRRRDAMCDEGCARRPSRAPRLHHACQSPSDQGFSVAVRRISTSLPTFSVEKSAVAIRPMSRAATRRTRGLAPCRYRPRRPSG